MYEYRKEVPRQIPRCRAEENIGHLVRHTLSRHRRHQFSHSVKHVRVKRSEGLDWRWATTWDAARPSLRTNFLSTAWLFELRGDRGASASPSAPLLFPPSSSPPSPSSPDTASTASLRTCLSTLHRCCPRRCACPRIWRPTSTFSCVR
jgi:hypothetical protein